MNPQLRLNCSKPSESQLLKPAEDIAKFRDDLVFIQNENAY
jgi:hypothetical protein